MAQDLACYETRPPCALGDFGAAELALGHAIPAALAELYRLANGLRGPTNAGFLYPLIETQDGETASAVSLTLSLRAETWQPKFWRGAVAFGDNGVGATWGIDVETGSVFEWTPEDGEEVTPVNSTIRELWAKTKEWYDQVSRGRAPHA
ncbi:SMI1/KNR4 family protein [Roseateles sp. YR242]|uniref:SMI1/KNR4 family protein n=1 Tax=Roseateles sp. YR242 TaxID=1855305 RepID=UPI003857906D